MSVAFSEDGKTALSGSLDKTVKWWNLSSGRVIKSLESYSKVWSVAFSEDSETVLSGNEDGSIKWWDLSSGEIIKSLEAHSKRVNSVAFSEEGKTALSGSEDTTIRLWNLETGEEIIQMVAFDKDEWVVMLPQNYYVASPNGEKYINVSIGNTARGIEEHSEAQTDYNRPDLVEAVLRNHI